MAPVHLRQGSRAGLAALAAALLSTACDGGDGRADAGSATASASAAAPPLPPVSAPAPPAGSAPAITSGPCHGKAPGAHACDGARLVRCDDAAGGTSLVATCLDIERCDAASGKCEPSCPEGEVYIPPTGPAGFKMGRGMSAFGFGNRKSQNTGHGSADTPHKVVLTRPFCIDANEVTAAQIVACVKEKGCPEPSRADRWATYPKKPDYPANMIDWTKSKFFCEANGKSLPTEAQWEWAATGDDGRKWPWGNEEPDCERTDFTRETLVSPGGDSGCHGGGPSKVGAHPKGDKVWPTGNIHDLAGNVWEWVLDSYVPYSGASEVDPVHIVAGAGNKVVRGGGWNRSARGILTAFRGGAIITYQVPGLGLRCVRNPR